MRKFDNVILSLIVSIILFGLSNHSFSQEAEFRRLFQEYAISYEEGDLFSAQESLLSILEFENELPKSYLFSVYNNLGVVLERFGRFNDARKAYLQAQDEIIFTSDLSLFYLATSYGNIANIYRLQSSYSEAIAFNEKSIRLFLSMDNSNASTLKNYAAICRNLGITYYRMGRYKDAIEKLIETKDLISTNNLSGIAFCYLNLAKSYDKLGDTRAEEFYILAEKNFIAEYGENYYRISDLFFDYGLYLRSLGRYDEALDKYNRALSICLNSYGKKSTFVALSYKHLGDYYFEQSEYNQALDYYQKSLCAVVTNFDEQDINTNPPLDSVLFDTRLHDNLKRKSEALMQLALMQDEEHEKVHYLKKSLETIELAIDLTDRIRNGYMSVSAKTYLVENEKETYISAIDKAQQLYNSTHDKEYIEKMFNIAVRSKSAVLRSEISDNKLFYSVGIPDSIQLMHNQLSVDIGYLNKLILDESVKPNPKINQIEAWRDDLFDLNRQLEKTKAEIDQLFPQYRNILERTGPIPLKQLQRNLKRNETLVEYLISNNIENGSKDLFAFTVTRNDIFFHKSVLDSLVLSDLLNLCTGIPQFRSESLNGDSGYKIETALFSMYENLIKPLEKNFCGNKLVIIPDEEISFLPFDAFLTEESDPGQLDYEDMSFLLEQYSISFGYSSSLVFNRMKSDRKRGRVFAFAPDYTKFQTSSQKNLTNLAGAKEEISQIFCSYNGEQYYGETATESRFKDLSSGDRIFHLAMHSQVDSLNPGYSSLVFSNQDDIFNDGLLYNYEIGLLNISSPMIILSSCQSGTGILYSGEGVMSLARQFTLAGAGSVVKTLWDVNDRASEKIITSFYQNLAKGCEKDKALQLAKLDYLRNVPPSIKNPYYWAAHQVIGDTSAIKSSKRQFIFYTVLFCAIAIIILVFYYLRRRRIFFARFW